MNKYLRHKRSVIACIILTVLSISGIAQATSTASYVVPDVLISEVMPDKTLADKTDEFIELYNASDSVIAGGSLQVQIYASTAISWADKPYRTVTLTHDFLPGKHYLLASSSDSELKDTAYDTFGSGMSASYGHIRLFDSTNNQIGDYFEWGDATKYHTLQPSNSLALPISYSGSTSQSYKRKIDEDGHFIDSGVNSADFVTSLAPSPEADNVAPDGYQVIPQTAPGSSNTDNLPSTSSSPTSNPAINPIITELLPNPASPLTDEKDEFVELYNPAAIPFNVKNYTLEVGTTTKHDYTFTTDTIIQPLAYMAFFSATTQLSLSNTSGQARLLDSSGKMIDETDQYGAAADGQAWALADGLWQWSATPTPGSANLVTSPLIAVKAPIAPKSTKPIKTTAAKGKAASRAKAAKASAKKTTKKKAKKIVTASFAGAASTASSAPIHTKVLAGVAIAAVLYGIYEYRHDVANRFYLFRANRAALRTARAAAQGRRSAGASE